MGNKNMKKNIYQKLHSACIEAGSVKKAEKVKGMHFNPLLHDQVNETATQALLNNGLYATCNYLHEVIPAVNQVMAVCTMRVYDIDDPTQHILVEGCSAFGNLDKFGTGQAMSYSRKYAFLNLLNLKTGIKDEDGYTAKPFKQNSPEKSVEANPQYEDDNVDVEEIKNHIKDCKTIEQFNLVRDKYKDQIQYLIKNNLRAYRQVSDIAGTHKIKLDNNNAQQ
jgi:hypothetical protein